MVGNIAVTGSLVGPMAGGAATWTPASISDARWLSPYAGLFQDSGLTIPAAHNDPVGGWADQGVNGTHANQSSGDNRPVVNTTAFGAAMPGIVFTAVSSHYLAWDGIASLITGDDKPFSLVYAYKLSDVAANYIDWSAGNSANNDPRHFLTNLTNTSWRLNRQGDTSSGITADGGTPDTSTRVVTYIFTGTVSTLRINGAPVINAAAQNVPSATFNRFTLGAIGRIGYASFINGIMGDRVFIPRAISVDEMNLLESFVAGRCGVSYPF